MTETATPAGIGAGTGSAAGTAEPRALIVALDPAVTLVPVTEPGVTGSDLTLRGRVTADAAIETLTISATGTVRHAVTPPPSRGLARHVADFACTLRETLDDGAARVPVRFAATLADGATAEAEIAVTIGPDGAGVSGATALPAEAKWLAPVAARVERAVRRGAHIELRGWAIAARQLVTVQAHALTGDGPRLLGAAHLMLAREDVARAYPRHANSAQAGFFFAGDLPSELLNDRGQGGTVDAVRVEAITGDGACHVVDWPLLTTEAAAPEEDPERDEAVRLNVDEATLGPDGLLLVSGWCVAVAGVARIAVSLDGRPLGEAVHGQSRPDVARAFGDVPQARDAGFRFLISVPAPTGPAAVEVLAEDRTGITRSAAAPLRMSAPAAAAAPPPEAAAEAESVKLMIDQPIIAGGVVPDPVTGRLTIEGWALARQGVEGIDVLLDGAPLGAAYYGLARQDVAGAFPDWPNALRCGYAFHCPARSLKNGPHEIRLLLRALTGAVHATSFRIEVRKAEQDAAALVRARMPAAEAAHLRRLLATVRAVPRVVFVLRATAGEVSGAAGREAIRATLRSLLDQTPIACEALLLPTDAARAAFEDAVASLPEEEAARLHFPGRASAPVLRLRETDLIGLITPGDRIACDAVAQLVLAVTGRDGASGRVGANHPGQSDFVYCDESRIDPGSGEREPFHKPDWSPSLLEATNYLGRLWLARGALLRAAGIDGAALQHGCEYDLALRLTEVARDIRHVPALLAYRAAAALDPAEAEAAALSDAFARRGVPGTARPGRAPGAWRREAEPASFGRVSIIIPTCAARGHIRTCLTKLKSMTAYADVEIVAIDNIPAADAETKTWLAGNADAIVDIPEAFNWSRFNNLAAARASGEWLLFLNDDVEVIASDWLDAMLRVATREGVGAVGPQLLYPDGKVQHAGMFLSGTGLGRHAFRFADRDEGGYFGLALTEREVSAVTGACMLVRRAVFDAAGGFDEAHDVINNDLDFCLRLHEAGLRVVYTPDATLYHHELASRAGMSERFDTTNFEGRWRRRFIEGDPYFNPNLLRDRDDVAANDEPTRAIFGGHPLFAREEVLRILAVKVDHIGDFITALPALRRIKSHFPAARLSVMASGTAQAFTELEDAIDEMIVFDFFHVKSALGQRALTAGDLAALRARLEPHRFDIAIDLRKHVDTRELLRASGARVLAGFDYLGQFPWLDVALEWEGDRGLHGKRFHVTDDLIHLVDAVAAAAETDRDGMRPDAVARIDIDHLFTPKLKRLFRKPVVAIHPGAGNELKQWPLMHYAALIGLLTDHHDVNVVMVGGPDDAEAAEALRGLTGRGARMETMIGRVKLRELASFLARCRLYVGNDSGPKHIAAAAGVPTVGVHSGTVDATEWAPLGREAVALARSMSCGPCYISAADACPRGMACLTGIDPITVYRHCARMLSLPAPVAGTRTRFYGTAASEAAD